MTNFKKKWLDDHLPQLIKYMPPGLDHEGVKVTRTEKDGSLYYDHLDDSKIILDHQIHKYGYYFGGGVIISALFIALLARDFSIFEMVLIGIGLLFILYGATVGRRETVMDRKNGVYIFAGRPYGKPMAVPFVDTQGYWVSMGGASGAIGKQLRLKYYNKTTNAFASGMVHLHGRNIEEQWSFLIWYMDRNRPLPPGEAFDAYREADFERRKAEGFPPPLFPSTFPTLEATPAQQEEREQYWKDEDYYGTSESAWY